MISTIWRQSLQYINRKMNTFFTCYDAVLFYVPQLNYLKIFCYNFHRNHIKGADILFNNLNPILNNPYIFGTLIIWSLVCFTVSLLYGIRKEFKLFYPVIVAALFIPTIFIYYNSTAWIYSFIYAVIAFAGGRVGSYIVYK